METIEEYKVIEKAFPGIYHNLNQIGGEQHAKVFKAETKTNQTVAIKVISTKDLDEHKIELMQNEIKLLSESDNQNVIKLYKSHKTSDYIILVLEFCCMDVNLMTKRYYRGKLPTDIAIIVFRQLVNGLSYLHKKNIIHRDLQLENFCVSLKEDDLKYLKEDNDLSCFERATYKLIDLGLAKKLNESNKYTMTRVGTETNMAPEILLEQPYSFEADMYSLGVCLYQMLVGKYPYFDPQNRIKTQDLIKRENADVSLITNPEFKDLVVKMLKYDPKQRLQWHELYQHKYISLQDQGLMNPIDLELKNNRDLIYQENGIQLQQTQELIQQIQTQEIYNQSESDNKKQIFLNFNYNFSLSIDPTQKYNDEILQLYHIRNQYILILKLSDQLGIILTKVNDVNKSFWSKQGTIGMYQEYFQMIAKQLYLKLNALFLKKEQILKNLENFQHLKKFVAESDSQKLEKVYLREGNSEGFIAKFQKYFNLIRCEPLESINFKKQYEHINIDIYKMLEKMYGENSNQAQNNLKKNDIILAMLYTARSRILFKVELMNIDYRQEEIIIAEAKNNPDILLKRITQILAPYKLVYN